MSRLRIVDEWEATPEELELLAEMQMREDLREAAISAEKEARDRTLAATEKLRCRYALTKTANDIVSELLSALKAFDYWRLSRPDINKILDDKYEAAIDELAKSVLRECPNLPSKTGVAPLTSREVRENAEKISGRRNDKRGQPPKYDREIIEKVTRAIEQIVGKRFSHSRSRNTTADSSKGPESGPPSGEMFDLLVATYELILRVAELAGTPTDRTAKAEGIKTTIRQRSRPGPAATD